MFIGVNLQRVRTLYGYSRRELGETLNISEQAIWQFENEITQPSFELVTELKKLFSVKTSYFYKEHTHNDVFFIEDNVAYREADIISRKRTLSEVEYLNTIYPIVFGLESYLSIPPISINKIRDEVLKIYHSNKIDTLVKIEKIANIAREKLQISNDNTDLLFKIEKSGVYVVEKNIGGKADAYSAWDKEGLVSFIILGKRKSAVRRNFDLAHELGHLLMHYNMEFISSDKKEYNQMEAEANQFASFFLLPKEEFKKDFLKIGHKSNPTSFINLKLKYNVSIQALEMRAFKLKLISPQQNSYFYRQIARMNYRLEEPLDKEMVIKKPGKIRSIMNLVFKNELISFAEFQEKFGIETNYLCNLFSIDKEFFDQFNKDEVYSPYNSILSLKRNY
ncbi:ImmA/IrrE family metallo-endopeptidase [Melissococcus plutonius]|nr:ImmA/IrrE family metallo-endopeptidase [Melissococcus plutonius]MCV2501901.1 ImmA/IrrE family metallo-endopeptidase [Melissococcus plutonius]MCV2505886.1 ImmA/IrrE family metallo-endopeptidase [Melissococcus plutonius]MCV2520604.1 ImmA/IrrE family metallo-endopeptidase [Melissococcus plutonius]MCV2528125.1 ImmA/IrrE family metallo-endopeptidase [Melissococcus plutonius]